MGQVLHLGYYKGMSHEVRDWEQGLCKDARVYCVGSVDGGIPL